MDVCIQFRDCLALLRQSAEDIAPPSALIRTRSVDKISWAIPDLPQVKCAQHVNRIRCHHTQNRIRRHHYRTCVAASPLRLRSCLKIPISGARQAGVPAFLIVLGCCLFGVLLHRAWLLPIRRASSAAVLAAYTSAFTLEHCRASHPRESAGWRSASRPR